MLLTVTGEEMLLEMLDSSRPLPELDEAVLKPKDWLLEPRELNDPPEELW